MFGDDLVVGAAEVDVDEVVLLPVDDFARGLAHAGSIGAAELDAEGALGVVEVGVVSGTVVTLEDSFGRDELGDHDIGTEFLAEGAEHDIRDAGHGSQVEREEVVMEPGKHEVN